MKIHHLSCATMCPPLGKLMVNADGYMVCHCLLIETGAGLVLVDTGIGEAEHREPRRWLGRQFMAFANPRSEPERAAVRQIERLGFKPADVRHIIVTHLDLDHAGGIPDFPDAQVHVYGLEQDAAQARSTRRERSRYKPHQWQSASWVRHDADGQGEAWFGFSAIKLIADLDLALVPLLGHTRGHCGVAVQGPDGWLLHCGDAYFHANEVDPERPRCTPGLRLFQRLIAMDNAARVRNQARLVALAREQRGAVRLFCAHDPKEYAALSAAAPSRVFA